MRQFVILLLCLAFAQAPVTYAGTIKCWVNRDGVRECGNAVPPEYASKGYEEITKQGIVVNRVAPAKTTEQLQEEAQQQELLDEQARLAQEQEERDRVLLNTFSNVDEITMTRDGKIAIVDTEIALANRNIDILSGNLDSLRKSAANMERRGKPVSARLQEDITSTRAQIKRYTDFIAKKRAEQEEIRRTYDEDLERFRKLRPGASLGSLEQAGTQ